MERKFARHEKASRLLARITMDIDDLKRFAEEHVQEISTPLSWQIHSAQILLEHCVGQMIRALDIKIEETGEMCLICGARPQTRESNICEPCLLEQIREVADFLP